MTRYGTLAVCPTTSTHGRCKFTPFDRFRTVL